MDNLYTVLITAITTLGGASMWRYFEKRAARKEADEHWMQNDCATRIMKLELLLDAAGKEKDELRGMVLKLSVQVAELTTKIAYFESQNKTI
jgi:phage shock protein A